MRNSNRKSLCLRSTFKLIFLMLLIAQQNVEAQSTPLEQTRSESIVSALLAKQWDPKPLEVGKAALDRQPMSTNQMIQLWQGNIPKVSLSFSDLELHFSLGESSERMQTFRIGLDVVRGFLRVAHSKGLLQRFAGGALFESEDMSRVHSVYLPGRDGSGMLTIVPPWRAGQDIYMLLCPRELRPNGDARLRLAGTSAVVQSLLLRVGAQLRAVLYSGQAAGTIKASIERSAAVPPGRESEDSAKGINPVVQLNYFPQSGFAPAPFPPSGEAAEFFAFKLDMQLPAGYRRSLVEEYDMWVKRVEIPQHSVAVPVATALLSDAAVSVTPQLREKSPLAGIDTVVDSGTCYLIAGERRMQRQVLFNKE